MGRKAGEPALQDDILFAERTELALEEFYNGTFTKIEEDKFVDAMSSW